MCMRSVGWLLQYNDNFARLEERVGSERGLATSEITGTDFVRYLVSILRYREELKVPKQ